VDKLLICGIPAVGKSTFSQWLSTHHGYFHFDIDQDGDIGGCLYKALQEAARLRSAMPLDQEVQALSSGPIVVDWGFPMGATWMVEALRDLGFQLWWLDGDRVAARLRYSARGTGSIMNFDTQLRSIEDNWHKIESLFGQRTISTLGSDGKFIVGSESIFEKIGSA
jgi:hypothetical protein